MSVDVARHTALAAELLPPGRLLVGDERPAGSGGTHPHVNPATGREQAAVTLASPDEVSAAVDAARAAFAVWRGLRPDERRSALLRLAALVRRDTERIGGVLTLECAVPAATATALPRRAADYLEYYAGFADKLEGRVIPIFPENAFDYTLAEPYGVIGIISTWNGGISSVARKAGAALAAGNTVVVKPMELAPFSSLIFGELALEAGLPAGAVNVVPGDAAAGAALVRHPGVNKISFTGGHRAARAILAGAAEVIKPVVLELGGKSGNLVFADADLEAAGRFAGTVCMGMAGQGCVFPTRLIVHESVHDEVVRTAVATAAALPVGDPLAEATAVGPVVSADARARILGMLERARAGGAGELLLGGGPADVPTVDGGQAGGFFVAPTVFDRVDPAAEIAQEEVFGPVLTVLTFRDEDEAVELANGTAYGLAGYVHTSDLRRAHRVAAALDAGYVSVNGFAALPASAPFGGFGGSGFGKEGGRAGLDEFIRTKNVYLPL
ncbi:aldehyde dehydrogenase [Frankia sp. CNm7]|uniref:Aldehyde dehydrogenase n=1 Tax=Frankia nepalensis TaxID=1836974 RepID=A0A937UUR9_9ACTN|nr:aldehyde dehydrogenase family protein [Frankia nepalensis]MBL7500504.1 aldehyde dehydrogenase [Frankia nepalensis]MBL7511217.1 aldehyde dehydrogenase [Frankia nepalensis]MBL7518941.1 aldehyde dehydrogenase [Frankia nepalensis]MBL7631471.1 aldehyde dehydrogenase [Frankia nepalensis]